MRRFAFVTAVIAALAAFPALAEENEPARGSEQDPFSQGYTGIREHEAPSPGGNDRKDSAVGDCKCAHRHESKAAKPSTKA